MKLAAALVVLSFRAGAAEIPKGTHVLLRMVNSISTRTAVDFQTKILPKGDKFVLNGQKFYSTGALFAHLVLVVAADAAGRSHVVFLDRHTPGLTLIV